jgi:outer membrane receptor protein involved in Fe transport
VPHFFLFRTFAAHLSLAIPLVAALLAAAPALALDGQVVHRATGAPVANAEVSILGLPGVAYTDAEGRFTWKPDPQPPFEVLVIQPGGRFMRPVLVERLPGGVLTIAVTPLADEAVTVVGSAPNIESTPGAGTATLSRGEIQERQAANLTEAVETVAGVSVVSEGQAAVPAIRGLARGRTLILIDGARVTSERRVGPSATYLDPFMLESVEVSRGPGSVAYGSDAFGGVIDARTRRVAPGAPLAVRFQGALGAGVPEQHAGLELSKGFAQGGLLAQASYRHAGDYRSPEGDVFNSGWRGTSVLVRGDHTVGAGLFSAGWQSDFGRDIERPRNNSRKTRFFYPTEDSHRFTASYELNREGRLDHVDVTAFIGRYTQVTDQDTFATATTPRGVERADVAANDFQVRARAESLVGPAKATAGVDVSGRYGLHALDIIESYDLAGALAATTVNVSTDRARRTDVGFFGQIDAPLGRSAAAAAGVRGDVVTTDNRGGYFGDHSTTNGSVAGFASLTAPLARGLSVTGQVSRGFRDPTLSDRSYRGPTGRGFITGNPDLEPETSLQLDLGVRYTAARYRWAFYAYQYRITNLVERYQTGKDFYFFRNRGRARIRGVELELQAELAHGLSAGLTGQVQRGVALDDGTALDDISTDTVAVQLRREIGAKGYAQARVAVYARDTHPGPSEQSVGAHTLVNVTGGYRLSPHLELRAVARNLLDQSYLLSPDTRAVLAPGASVMVSAVIGF